MNISCSITEAPRPLALFTTIISVIISIVTISGNVTIILLVMKDPMGKLRTSFTYLLVNLAFSDLIVGIIAMPLSVYAHYLEYERRLSPFIVPIIHVSFLISTLSSLLSLMALCVERLLVVWRPIEFHNMNRRRCKLGGISCVIWFVSFTISVLYFRTYFLNYLMVSSTVSLVVGMTIFIVLYYQYYQFFKGKNKELSKTSVYPNISSSVTLKQEQKILKTFILMIITFLLTYLPAVVLIYIALYCLSCSCVIYHVTRDIQFLLIASNSMVNPFICTLQLSVFWASLKEMLRKVNRKEKNEVNVSKSNNTSNTIEELA